MIPIADKTSLLPLHSESYRFNYMKKLIVLLVLTVAALFASDSAFAFCIAPTAPDPPFAFAKPEKPSVPYSVNEIMRTHTCENWEISSYRSEMENYRSEVENYLQQLRLYAEEAKSFVNDAIEYANCEIMSLD